MSKYDVNYNKLAVLLLPMCLRGDVMSGLLRAMVAPLGLLHASLMELRRDSTYRLTHTGQVYSLRGVLNDRFDPIQRGIMVTDNETQEVATILYMREASRHTIVAKRATGGFRLFRRGYGGSTSVGFWVNIPQRVADGINENEVQAVVNAYKLAAVKYGIAYI